LAFVVPPSHPLARRAKVSIAELASESFIAHHVSSPYRQRVIDTFAKRRIHLRMPVQMPTIEAIKKFVAMGNGVALLPAITVESELARREFVRVEVPELAFDRKLRFVYRRDGTLSYAAQALLTVAREQSVTKGGRFAFLLER
jgi:DNA-binding transcriptional LysR family regulator